MDAREDSLLQVANALPDHFEFYHLGRVATHPTGSLLDEGCGIAFHIEGDIRAVMIILFAKALDPSLYSELGNIIASKMITYLYQHHGMDLSLSAPQTLNQNQLNQILKSGEIMAHRNYAHFCNDAIIPVETFVLAGLTETNGNA
jgi:hypothetical protein